MGLHEWADFNNDHKLVHNCEVWRIDKYLEISPKYTDLPSILGIYYKLDRYKGVERYFDVIFAVLWDQSNSYIS